MEEKSLRETTTDEWLEKVRFGDISDMKSDLSDCGITEDRRKEVVEEEVEDAYSYVGLLRNVKVLRDAWIHDLDKQDMTFYEAAAAEEEFSLVGYAELLRNAWNDDLDKQLYEEEEEEDEDGYSSEEYDYDYTDCSQEYRDMFKHRLAPFLHEELPTDKKRNPTLMGKQLIIKAFEEGKDGTKDSFENSQTGKEAGDALFKNFLDFPRTIMYMATISHSLS